MTLSIDKILEEKEKIHGIICSKNKTREIYTFDFLKNDEKFIVALEYFIEEQKYKISGTDYNFEELMIVMDSDANLAELYKYLNTIDYESY